MTDNKTGGNIAIRARLKVSMASSSSRSSMGFPCASRTWMSKHRLFRTVETSEMLSTDGSKQYYLSEENGRRPVTAEELADAGALAAWKMDRPRRRPPGPRLPSRRSAGRRTGPCRPGAAG